MAAPHIPPLAAETLFHVGPVAVSNTMINTWLALVGFLILGYFISKKAALRPGRLQNWCEYFLEILLGYFDQVTQSRQTTLKFLPIVGSVFFFILFSNWLGLIPGTGSLTWQGEPILRPANTDLNLTVAMALVAVVSSHVFGFLSVGIFTHLNKFVQIGSVIKSLKKGPVAVLTALVEFAVGLLEIVSELAKVLSLSLRLFGNIFAGEVLMMVMLSLVSVLVPTPFMLLELLVGIIQASVFAMLTIVYMTIASSEPHGAEH
ncbi:MAG: FoF1 ATP synthase subunit a [Candidatus Magasanikbacteria bacterium]|nr:FoF1 ATP synthase subunit a [Candidatus Magasanikbacteria bacterium]